MEFKSALRVYIGIICLTVTGFQRANAIEEPTDSQERPNILFAISDDQSWFHTSASGCKCIDTPNFDRVAREGILFNNSFTGSPGCTPSRSSVLTGRYPWQLEQAGTHASSFPIKFVTYPDLLEGAGYFVGFTGKGWGPGNFEASGRTRNPAGPEFNSINAKSVPAKGIKNYDYAANFSAFMKAKPEDKPFCFWYGGKEPHRGFEKGSGVAAGKKLADAPVPSFLPDVDEIRSDILDYCLEIEWFDEHLGRMIKLLEQNGQLENTIIVVTSDNGMAFPRAKANTFEYGIHMPLAIRWPKKVPGGRVVDDLISHTDFAPTFLEFAGVDHPSQTSDTPKMTGRSLVPLLTSNESGTTSFARGEVYSCRERHSSSRWNNLTYPQRCIRTPKYLMIRNFKPERWPAGTPRKLDSDGNLGPVDGGYHDIDASPSLAYMIKHKDEPAVADFLSLSVDHRPAYQLYDIQKDPGCRTNLVGAPSHVAVASELEAKLNEYLQASGDPRMNGTGDVWDDYIRYSKMRKFPKPEWAEKSGRDR